MKNNCQVCEGEEAEQIMSWDGQQPVKICPSCIVKAKEFLAGAYCLLRPIPKPKEYSKEEKEVFKKLEKVEFASARQLGVAEGGLISLVGRGMLSMTKAHGMLFFFKRKPK